MKFLIEKWKDNFKMLFEEEEIASVMYLELLFVEIAYLFAFQSSSISMRLIQILVLLAVCEVISILLDKCNTFIAFIYLLFVGVLYFEGIKINWLLALFPIIGAVILDSIRSLAVSSPLFITPFISYLTTIAVFIIVAVLTFMIPDLAIAYKIIISLINFIAVPLIYPMLDCTPISTISFVFFMIIHKIFFFFY